MTQLPPTVPTLDWSNWSGLGNLLSQKYRTVRTLTDPILPGGALAPWLFTSGGTLSFNSSGAGFGNAQLASPTVVGQSAFLRVASTSGGTTQMQISPSAVGAMAFTLEGLAFHQATGFDFVMGFEGNTFPSGGCELCQFNGSTTAQIRTYAASGGGVTLTPRAVTDAVFVSGSQIVTSATAAFVSADLGQPVSGLGSLILPGSVIASVDSATQIHMSIPALGAGSAQTLKIGQVVNYDLFGTYVAQKFNLSFVWWCTDGYAWVMQDDQVVAEINVGTNANYSNTPNVLAQAQIFCQSSGVVSSFSWDQARLSIASNGN